MNMKKLIMLFICILTLINFPSTSYADKSGSGKMYDLMNNTTFLSPAAPTTFDNGLEVKLAKPIAGFTFANLGQRYWVTSDAPGSFSFTYTLTLEGVSVELRNTSSQVLIVRWAESALSISDFSGIPFLDGMKYMDAGNPSATQDTIIAPGQSIKKDIYISQVFFDSSWQIKGIPIPKQDSLNISLTLKVLNGNNNAQYFNLVSPNVGIPN